MAPKPTPKPTPKPKGGFADWGTGQEAPTPIPTDLFNNNLSPTLDDRNKAEAARVAKAKAARSAAIAKEKERQRLEAEKRNKAEVNKKKSETQHDEQGKIYYLLEMSKSDSSFKTKFIKAAQAYEKKYKTGIFESVDGRSSASYKTDNGSYYGLNTWEAKDEATKLLGTNAPKLLKISYSNNPTPTATPTVETTSGKSLDDKAKADSLTETPTLSNARADNGLVNVYSGPDSDGNLSFWWNGNVPGDKQGNQSADAHVYVIGDASGKYVPSTSGYASYKVGSPVGAQEYVDRTIDRYMKKEGGLLELKKMLIDKRAYGSDATGARSLQAGEVADTQLYSALHRVFTAISSANLTRLRQNKNQNVSLIGFEDYMRTPGKLPSTASIGDGNDGTTIQHVRFKPEQYEVAIDQLFQATVGRGATESELNDFLGKLRSYEQANPATTTYSGQGTNMQTVTTSGGVDEGVVRYFGREQALNAPDAEKNAKENKYFGYLMEALAPTNASQLG